MEKKAEIERSIITKFRKTIWRSFTKAVRDYELISENDKIAVCISGGKDSFLMAKCLEELKKHGKIKFDLVYILMNPGYNKENLDRILDNATILGIKLEIFKSNIFEVSENLGKNKPCYLCARMRRGFLYARAKELGCNKIALGHHFDDVVETILLSILYGGEYKSMPPKLHSSNFDGMELIRPLYLVREEDIICFCKYNNLNFINCACSFTEKSYSNDSKRLEVKMLIKKLEEINKNVAYNIFASSENVNVDTVLGTKQGEIKKSFLDDY